MKKHVLFLLLRTICPARKQPYTKTFRRAGGNQDGEAVLYPLSDRVVNRLLLVLVDVMCDVNVSASFTEGGKQTSHLSENGYRHPGTFPTPDE